MSSVQLLVPYFSLWSFPEPLFSSSGPISALANEPWFVCLLQSDSFVFRSLGSDIQSLSYIFSESSPLPVFYFDISMVRTRGGSRLRPRVRFSSPEKVASASAPAPAPVPAPVPSPVPEAVPEEPQGFRRYQTRMGPRAPSPVPRRRVRRARPSKRAPHRAQASHLLLGLHRHQSHQLPRRHPHLNCHLPHGSGGPCS